MDAMRVRGNARKRLRVGASRHWMRARLWSLNLQREGRAGCATQ